MEPVLLRIATMIRAITRQQILAKTAQGERVVLIEAQPDGDFESRHIAGAIFMPVNRVRDLAMSYLPDAAAEIVVYGEGPESTEPSDVAGLLSMLGYHNLYIYHGGKRDWFTSGGFIESVHRPPRPGEQVQFAQSPQKRDRAEWGAFFRSMVLVLAAYGLAQMIRSLRGGGERELASDEASELPMASRRAARVEDWDDFERSASSFNAASAAE
jgi:rhodanese-related sulfurtransferase